MVKVAGAPLNVTTVVPVKFSPWMSTLVPGGPLVGVNELIDGGGGTQKQQLWAVPFRVVTEITPAVAPLGTVAWSSESESSVKFATLPLKPTEVTPVKSQPKISTLVPTC